MYLLSKLEDLKQVVNYIQNAPHKVYVHKFNIDSTMQELETLYRYGKTIYPLSESKKIEDTALTVGAKFIVGPNLTEQQKEKFSSIGIEKFEQFEYTSLNDSYVWQNSMFLSNQL